MQDESPYEEMAAPGGPLAPVAAREPGESSLGQGELLLFPLWKSECVLALMDAEKFRDSVAVYFKGTDRG